MAVASSNMASLMTSTLSHACASVHALDASRMVTMAATATANTSSIKNSGLGLYRRAGMVPSSVYSIGGNRG